MVKYIGMMKLIEAHNLGIEYDIEDIINKQGGTFDEEEVGKKQDT